MKGYKAFQQDMTCRGFQYEVGKTHEMDGEIKLCERGFHFCVNPNNCYKHYLKDSRLCEVDALGDIEGDTNDKLVTNRIKIVREVIGIEKNRIIYGNNNGYSDESCSTCLYFDKEEDEYPCNACKHNYVDKWEGDYT